MRLNTLIGFVALLLVASGCRDNRDLVVSVNGDSLTKAMLEQRVEQMIELKLKSKADLTMPQVEKLRKTLRRSYPAVFIDETLIAQCLAHEGVSIRPECLDAFRAAAVKGLDMPKVKNWQGLEAAVGPLAAFVADRVVAEASRQALRDWLVERNPTNLPADFVERRLAEVKAFNERMDATNAVAKARAEAAWERLKQGEAFGAVARACSDIPEERKDRGKWANLDWKQIEGDAQLYEWVRKLQPGEFSPPIEADNGLMIVRVDKKDEKECVLSRVYFQLAMYCRVPTPQEIVDEVNALHAETLFQAKYAELRSAAVIVKGESYPQSAKPKGKPKPKPKPKGMAKAKAKAKAKAAGGTAAGPSAAAVAAKTDDSVEASLKKEGEAEK